MVANRKRNGSVGTGNSSPPGTGKTRRSSKTKGSGGRKQTNVPARKRKAAKTRPARNKKPSIPSHLRTKPKTTGVITYVPDSNIIMHHTDAIFMFDEHEVIICGKVWDEMDKHKKGSSDAGFNIRKATRYLDALVRKSDHSKLKEGLVLEPPEGLRNGKPHTGRVRWDFSQPDLGKYSQDDLYLNPENPDHHILAICLKLQQQGKNVVLISNDRNFRVFAAHAGIVAEEYFNEVIEYLPVSAEDEITGFHHLPEGLWEELESAECVPKDGLIEYTVKHPFFQEVNRNEFVVVPEDGMCLRVITKRSSTEVRLRTLKEYRKDDFFGVEPLNQEQFFARDLVLDPDIPAVSIAGGAGSGKTLCALAGGIAGVLSGRYKRIIISRSPQGADEDIGFLPGTEEEKMDPWLEAFRDNIEVLTLGDFDDNERMMTIDYVYQKCNIQLKSLNFMKGRSLRDSYIIIDEAQDLKPETLKMIVTRLGVGSKIVLLGNVDQINNKFVSEHTNGLSVFIRKSAPTKLAGHVTLQRGERSELATWAHENL